jgi:hypothetical protein
MFKKKVCKECGKKINGGKNFCPNCGNSLNSEKKIKNFGLLGKNDLENLSSEIKLPGGLGMLFNSLMKNLDKQFKEMDLNDEKNFIDKNNAKKQGISISILTSGNMPPKIKINQFGNKQEKAKIQKNEKNFQSNNFSKANLEKLSKFPREEPLVEMKRFSNKIIYEIKIPEVTSIKDISIIKLENSIEIKAIAKDKVYFKLIQINLPILDCNLLEGNLILEFDTNN